MDIEVDRERIVNKFKRNGHYLNKNSLSLVQQHLKGISNPQKRLDEVIQKINEMIVMNQQQFNDGTVKLAIQLLSHTSKTGHSFNTYDKFLQNIKKWTIYYVSPYQTIQRFFVDKPDPSLFQFQPQDFLEMNNNRFKAIRDYNLNKLKNSQSFPFIGVLYEKFVGQKNKIMLQNQVNEVQLIFPPEFNLECFLIPGCTYIAEGQFKSKDIQLFVKKLQLPDPLPKSKQNLFHAKLKLVCDNISLSKSGLNFISEDFKSYQFIYNKQENKKRPILVFGNVRINLLQVQKIKSIMSKYPQKIQCMILMIAEGEHEEIDLTKYISESVPIYIVPNINSEGPRILPKPPILKNDYRVKILTNPAKLSIQGKQCVFLNYPLLKNLYEKNLFPKERIKINQSEKSKMAANMLYSQNNVALTNKCFWRQSAYFNVSSEDFIFLCDKVFHQQNFINSKSGALTNVGNFQRDGEFVFFMPHGSSKIQLCDNKIL